MQAGMSPTPATVQPGIGRTTVYRYLQDHLVTGPDADAEKPDGANP